MNRNRMNLNTVRDINTRLYFASGNVISPTEVRPWQYVEMEYDRMGFQAPANVPRLESIEDADIWMCLDERVNRRMRMCERALAG